MRRSGFSLIELLIVAATLSLMLAVLLPAIQQARQTARRCTCQSNLKEIGLALQTFHDARRRLPRARLCGAPWQDGQDLYCGMLPSPSFYSGPGEVWWAPYDNRVPPTTAALPDFDPSRALLWPYTEGNRAIFLCPDGVDLSAADATFGQAYQISFALNGVNGGPQGARLHDISNAHGTSKVMLAWDHDNIPSCSDPKGLPVQPFTDPAALPHYPIFRHGGVFSVLACDGHVDSQLVDELIVDNFYVR